ncbi:hypothetical protein RhiirA4_483812 [Rhizophagus irregularis]|uniref:Uncharacterized protein n=1 Tax=Rhizophagus irregularis TaxID=588596 RepID=A0A2I1HN20_9GLOM|nr:hypothetical protein RhiirA4_483812 [Rhizophagus irregularis]
MEHKNETKEMEQTQVDEKYEDATDTSKERGGSKSNYRNLEKILYNCPQHGKNSSSHTNYLGTKHQKHDITWQFG